MYIYSEYVELTQIYKTHVYFNFSIKDRVRSYNFKKFLFTTGSKLIALASQNSSNRIVQ